MSGEKSARRGNSRQAISAGLSMGPFVTAVRRLLEEKGGSLPEVPGVPFYDAFYN